MSMQPASTTARVWLACQARCRGDGQRFDLIQPAVRCPDCGGLLDPVVDLDAIAADAPTLRDRLSDRRARPADARDRSGVWRFRDLFWPGDLASAETVTLGEGNAAVVELPWTLSSSLSSSLSLSLSLSSSSSSMPGLSVVCCGENPTGSFKDLGMTVLGTWGRAIARRRASQGKGPPTLLCASTGDTSAALAAYGARAGLPVVVLLPTDKISPAQLVQPLAHGACVIAIDGDFDTCMAVVAGIADRAGDNVADVDGLLLANSKNPIRLLGQLTVALEIAEAAWLGGRLPDVVCVPSGNLGNISALHLGFSIARAAGLIDRLPRLVACQVDAANPLYRLVMSSSSSSVVARETHASAIRIGAPVSLPRALKALAATNGTVTSVSEEALLSASARADRLGLLVCPQTAAALAGVEQLVARGEVGADDHVVVVATAAGLKFVEQKTAFHAGSTGLGPMVLSSSTQALRNAPRVVAADVDAVMRVMASVGGR